MLFPELIPHGDLEQHIKEWRLIGYAVHRSSLYWPWIEIVRNHDPSLDCNPAAKYTFSKPGWNRIEHNEDEYAR